MLCPLPCYALLPRTHAQPLPSSPAQVPFEGNTRAVINPIVLMDARHLFMQVGSPSMLFMHVRMWVLVRTFHIHKCVLYVNVRCKYAFCA